MIENPKVVIPTNEARRHKDHPTLDKHYFLYQVPYVVGKEVLEIGSGIGYGAKLMAERLPKRILAIDNCKDSLEYGGPGWGVLKFRQADFMDFPEDKWEVIVAIEVVEHMEDSGKFMEKVARMTGETAYISTLCNEEQKEMGSPLYHYREWGQVEFREFCREYFHNVVLIVSEPFMLAICQYSKIE